uniref:Pyruvate kinase n=1 Tax=Chlamydomonas leiostraca TaxID=1034604 RepID=A0A7S0RHC8_9CHLO|mmetsp:Transcript_22889/g.58375  ORF Transcript_22889/g.58375 Transcript_22889/m.58375 type:complete len:667 (+) Transcript_22889:219-2219(+)|eukprot:CAMPEP_0202868470 /NCGR_PEP_ID=MMETSP1391-20130828/10895_1 /ASSEMBLY_ACC=CAM_ASM_000867 /TAXON_ID=1034604 /ORGANISM="Chlamydomonas leiostraca, Strain SAG 11-49" /LENGTH=666 /DNA_ID=CAMNT_0049548645 /DNA_START=193 /DNA_END=2193 /DNA_ORIENTATION=+
MAPSNRNASIKAKTHFFKNLSLATVLEGSGETASWTGSKIMATIGPSIHDTDVLASLLEAGMVAGRVDLTWGPLDFHRNSLHNLSEAMRRTRRLCSTVIDTMGRELMIRGQWQVNDQGYPWVLGRNEVQAGQSITITTRPEVVATESILPIMYPKFTKMAQRGDTIYIARYLVSGAESSSLYLEVTDVSEFDVVCVAKNSAVLEGLLCVFHAERSQGNGLSNTQNELPLLSDWDKQCIAALGSEFEIDFLNLSYTRCAEDVREARRFLHGLGMTNTKLLAKIETRQALLNFQGILSEADGIVISRGNLGLDCDPEKMALVQKTLIQACNLVGKPVLITRVVDTMVNTPRPTRAEATDVANAVLDGVDGILLGAETLRGKYPLDAVRTVASICRAAEAVFDHSNHYEYLMDAAFEAMAQAVARGEDDEGDDDIATQMVANGELRDVAGGSALAGSSQRASFTTAVKTMAKFSMVASSNNLASLTKDPSTGMITSGSTGGLYNNSVLRGTPYLSKLESIASSAVRAADKVRASLIVVYTHTGQTAELVAKYRPPMPILTLVVPHLVNDGLKWQLEGRSYARQCLVSRGLLPFLATPNSGEALLEDAVKHALRLGLVKARDQVVVVQRVHEDFCVKIVAVADNGTGIERDEEGTLSKSSSLKHIPSYVA